MWHFYGIILKLTLKVINCDYMQLFKIYFVLKLKIVF